MGLGLEGVWVRQRIWALFWIRFEAFARLGTFGGSRKRLETFGSVFHFFAGESPFGVQVSGRLSSAPDRHD